MSRHGKFARLAPALILAGIAITGVAPATAAAEVETDPGTTEVQYSHVMRNYDDVQVRYDNPFYQ